MTSTTWVPPADGELLLRSKREAGWSTISGHVSINKSISLDQLETSVLSKSEAKEIKHVIKRAKKVKLIDNGRVRKLYERYVSISKSQGNGNTTCVFCSCHFKRLNITPRLCSDCLKYCCVTCSFDTLSAESKATVVVCKMCYEYRDFWKKSGGWFLQRFPLCGGSDSDPLSSSSSSDEDESDHTQMSRISDKPDKDEDKKEVEEESEPAVNDDIDMTFCKMKSILASNVSFNEQAGGNKMAAESREKLSAINSLSASPIVAPFDANNNLDATAGYHHSVLHGGNNSSEKTEIEQSSGNIKSLLKGEARACSSVNDVSTQKLIDQIATTRRFTKGNMHLGADLATMNPPPGDRRLSKKSIVDMSVNNRHENNEGSLGYLKFNVEYDATRQQLNILLISAASLVAKDSNGLSDPYVKIHLLPGIAKATKLRSKTVYKTLNPQYNEMLHYDGITNEDLETKTLRLSVLDEDKFGFDFIGEYRLPLENLIRDEVNEFYVPLEPHEEAADEETDTNYRGKINFALKYKKSKNCLYVKINRCTQLLPMDNGVSSDPYVEISVLPAPKDSKTHKQKTGVKKKTLDPEFNQEFKFTKIDINTLLTKTIEICVWDKDLGSNDFIGAVQLGQQRRDEELKHFYKMIKEPEIYHEQWHTLHLRDEIDED